MTTAPPQDRDPPCAASARRRWTRRAITRGARRKRRGTAAAGPAALAGIGGCRRRVPPRRACRDDVGVHSALHGGDVADRRPLGHRGDDGRHRDGGGRPGSARPARRRPTAARPPRARHLAGRVRSDAPRRGSRSASPTDVPISPGPTPACPPRQLGRCGAGGGPRGRRADVGARRSVSTCASTLAPRHRTGQRALARAEQRHVDEATAAPLRRNSRRSGAVNPSDQVLLRQPFRPGVVAACGRVEVCCRSRRHLRRAAHRSYRMPPP